MTEKLSFVNIYNAYIKNTPYSYPVDNTDTMTTEQRLQTGWHVIPNQLWRHYLTPKNWAILQMKSQAYRVIKASCTVFNMVPMTTQIAIQGTTVFTTFNNTIYALAYSDDNYETGYHDWLSEQAMSHDNINLMYKEGQYRYNNTADNWHQYFLPTYNWPVPHVRTATDQTWGNNPTLDSGIGVYPTQGKPTGVFWDPMNDPTKLLELRPGKNAVSFSWSPHECDKQLFFNTDGIASWFPWTTTGPYNASGHQRPGTHKLSTQMDPDRISTRYQTGATNQFTNDYTLQNLADQPVIPCHWWWHEMRASIVQNGGGKDNDVMFQLKPDFWFPGTEYETAKYGINQWFIKMIPLISNNTVVDTTAHVSIKMQLDLEIKPRHSAVYAPTWGPFNYHDLYSARSRDLNFHPSMVRYRTGGIRRTWQNMWTAPTTGDSELTNTKAHYREDPYVAATVSGGAGLHGTFYSAMASTTTTAEPKPELQVTFSNDLKSVRFVTKALKRTTQKDDNMIE